MRGSGRNIEMRDELLALRETTAQVYSHAEALKMRWADIEKAQASLYQVS
jgi:ESCRT-I complex subunit VPS37